MGNFPGINLPASIATIAFATPSAADSVDPITGESIEFNVNYTAFETASNYDFLNGSTTLKAGPTFNLDVDGDGNVSAFGDGLMVIRKLFGSAFAGDALTAKAISADATRDTDEIHEYIAAMTTVDPIG